ncbi:MAG: XRE family transcriptional regulator [Candidatus Omnitrophota bacterium]
MKIGKRLKALRKEKGMTLEDLSKKSGVALATLSRMENDKMTGTLPSHTKICKALGASLVELYRELEDEAKVVEAVPRKKRTEHFVHARKAKYELLVTKAMDKKIMPLMIKIGTGGETQKERNKPGVEKFIYVLAGAVEASVGGEKFELKHGDSLYFDASLEHFIKNRSKTEAEAICIISPPAL